MKPAGAVRVVRRPCGWRRKASDPGVFGLYVGRGWGFCVEMSRYGVISPAKIGVKCDEIIRLYYTGVEFTKACQLGLDHKYETNKFDDNQDRLRQ